MKVLFTDLDGTLLNDASLVSKTSYEYLTEFCRLGNKLVLSSGRPLDSILEVKEKAGLDFPGIFVTANNGALIYDCDRKENIHEIRLAMSTVETVWELARNNNIHIQTYTDDTILSIADDAEIKVYTERIHLPVAFCDSPSQVLTKAPFKLLAIELNSHEKLEAFRASVMSSVPQVESIFSNPRYLEIFSKEAGKGRALEWLCSYFNIPLEDSIAAGDAANDLSMLRAAHTSIAMSNGDPALFKHVTNISPCSNDEDGLIKCLKQILS